MNKLILLLVYLLVLILPLGTLFRFKITESISIVPQDLIVFTLSLLLLITNLTHTKSVLNDKFIRFQLLFILTGSISLILNSVFFDDINLSASTLYTLRYISYLGLLQLGFLNHSIKYLRLALFISMSIFLIIGYIQYFFFNDLSKLVNLGWDNHLYRLFSTFLDPNFAGILLAIIFLTFVSNALTKSLKQGYIYFIGAFFALISVYLTFSRTAIISLLGGIIISLVLLKKYLLIFLVFMAMSLILVFFADLGVEGLNPLRSVSTIGRIINAKESLTIIEKNSIFGVGFNSYRYAQLRYGTRVEGGGLKSNADSGTDNSWLFVMATTGIVGFVFYILSYYYLFKNLTTKSGSSYLLISVTTVMLIGALFINVLFYTPILAYFFLIIAFRKQLI